jgi:hypothetical protein
MEKINAVLIIEILGKPASYVKETLNDIVGKLGKEKDVKIAWKKIAEPKPLEEDANIFTSFAEVEIETSLQELMLIVFGYMPSHIEIIHPDELKIKNSDLNMFFNELVRKLHQYDELARTMMIEKQILANQLKQQQAAGKKEKKIKKKARS